MKPLKRSLGAVQRRFRRWVSWVTVAGGVAWVGSAALGADSGASSQWPYWRGPQRDGHAPAGQNPPVEWGEGRNILWKTDLPGRGHGSPIVVGGRVYLPTADAEKRTQQVLCFEQATGRVVWSTVVHEGKLDTGGHRNTSQASATLACEGGRIYANFLHAGGIHTTALDLSGKVLWQQRVGDFVTHQGFAASPVLHGSLVLVNADHKGGGRIVGLDQKTGAVVWSHARPRIPNYTTPAVLSFGGRPQAILAGCNLVTSLDPSTGKVLWEVKDSTEECVVTMVTDGERVFASGGYPRNHTVALWADGTGRVAWNNTTRVYVPSMIVREGHLYAVTDAGMAVCWNSATGEERWKERLGGEFYSSPVMVGQRVYATSLDGTTHVFEATPEKFRLLARNKLGDEVFATPAICESRIYHRVAHLGDARREALYCIGNRQ